MAKRRNIEQELLEDLEAVIIYNRGATKLCSRTFAQVSPPAVICERFKLSQHAFAGLLGSACVRSRNGSKSALNLSVQPLQRCASPNSNRSCFYGCSSRTNTQHGLRRAHLSLMGSSHLATGGTHPTSTGYSSLSCDSASANGGT